MIANRIEALERRMLFASALPTLTISRPASNASENGAVRAFTITRTGSTGSALTVSRGPDPKRRSASPLETHLTRSCLMLPTLVLSSDRDRSDTGARAHGLPRFPDRETVDGRRRFSPDECG